MFQIGIFAKFWEPGDVKTRLAAVVGEVDAALLYRQFVAVLLERFRGTHARRVLAYWPPDRREAFQEISAGNWHIVEQSVGDLGRRMSDYFRIALSEGADGVALIGSDSPTVPQDVFQRVQAELMRADLVLGPTDDGGYYVIGMSRWVPQVFEGIPWSSERVLEATIEAARRQGLRTTTIDAWYDVDQYSDLVRLRKELAEYEGNNESLRELGRSVKRVVDRVDRHE